MYQEITFGQAVKERRELLGLTQAELGRRVGCAAITIRRIEADNLRPSVQVAEHLAVALGVPEADYLAFVRLARTNREPSPLPTPPPILEEIGREDLSGRAIRGYQLGERIGSGGYGVVYLAVQATVNREVAVKIILPQYADRPEFIRRFEAEAQLVARLEHPHIVPLYDYWREPSVAYLVMRLMRGGNLASSLKNAPFLPETILPWLEQICAGLHAAHQAGVIHRDIKPANILLDEAGNAYLADFGIAKITDNDAAGETLEGMVLGSPAYISPEQILVEPVKPQSDVYSLGVMLYELLAGHKPFAGPTPFALIQQHLNEPFPSLATHYPNLPPMLDRVIQRATAKDQDQRYHDVLSLLAEFRRAIAAEDQRREIGTIASFGPTSAVSARPFKELTNPYKGLRAFGEADAADFFGREMLVQELLARLAEATDAAPLSLVASRDLARFLAVVGPSGSGKSSVVRAGLIPALRQGGLPGSDQWFISEMLPGTHPWEELEAALLRVAINPPKSLVAQLLEDERGLLRAIRRILPSDEGIELVLVIDQFEELFTLTADETIRSQFLNALVTAILEPRSRLRLIITLRADFTDRPLQYVDFGELLRQRTEFVLPLTPDELEQAIIGPARRVGLSLEPGLVATISRDVGQEPGGLPLLQYALTELFERREAHILTRAAYQSSGGVLAALARRAEELYSSLDATGQAAARQLFLRLVTLGEGTKDTRRRVLRTEVEILSDEATEGGRPKTSEDNPVSSPRSQREATHFPVINEVIDLFGRYRLLSFDRDPVTRGPTIEMAHEALLREWGRLREWLDANRNDIRLQRLLATAAAEWREANQDASFLLRGLRLDQFAGWAGTTSLALTPEERAFLEASLADRAALRTEEEARQRRELETVKKLLALSESQRLAAEANTLIQGGGNAELAALLSLRALNTAYTTQADIALQQASKGDYGTQLFSGHTAFVTSVAFSPDGKAVLTGSADATARLWDVRTGQELRQFSGHTNIIEAVAFSPDGQVALTGSHDKTARLWDVQTGQEVRQFSGHTAGIVHVAFSPDGNVALTASHDKTVRLWDVQTGQELHAFIHPDWVTRIAFSPDGQTILTGCHDSLVRLWETHTSQEVRVVGGASGGVKAVAFSPDGRYVLAGDGDGQVRLWDLQQPYVEPRLFTGHTSTVRGVAFSPDGKVVLTGSEDTTVRLWDRQTGQEMRRIVGTSHITYIALSPDGQELLVGYFDSTARLWAVQPPSDPQTLTAHTNVVTIARFSPDGRYVLTGSRDKTARLWDARTGQEVRQFIGHTDWVFDLAVSPDSRYVLTAGNWDKTARLWDIETGQEVTVFAHPDGVFAVTFSPDSRYALTGCQDRIARLWDLQAPDGEARTFTGYTGPVTGVAFSPDGRYVLTGGYNDKLAHLWDLEETGRVVQIFSDFSGRGTGIAFSPDGRYLLIAASDYTAQLWDLRQSGQPLGRFKGDNVAFSSDSQYFLTGGLKTAWLWDTVTRTQRRAFGVTQNLFSVAFSPDSQWVLLSGMAGLVQLWHIDYQTLVNSVCARVLRDFTDEEQAQYLINDHEPTCRTK